tara:strand:- start:1352 stop:1888 length:537 start_codon:yes stop_codon:yes gene_type:complete
MALFSIKPVYKNWLNDISKFNLSDKIDDFMISTKKVNNHILQGELSNKELDKEIKDLTTKHLYLSLEINNDKLSNPTKDSSHLNRKVDILNNNIKTLQNYEENYLLKTQKRSIDLLSSINLIFLPLTFIVGYYGMNFISMGSINNKTGPFNFKYGQLWVMFLISIVFITFYFIRDKLI